MTFLGVTGLPRGEPVGSEGARKWSVRVRHGKQRRRTESIVLAGLQNEVGALFLHAVASTVLYSSLPLLLL